MRIISIDTEGGEARPVLSCLIVSVHTFARVCQVDTDTHDIDSKPTRWARRRSNIVKRNAREYGSETWRGKFVDVLCSACKEPILSDAHPGEWWQLIKDVAPLIDSGDAFDPNDPRAAAAAALIEQRGAASRLSQAGIVSSFIGGLWVEHSGQAIGGREPRRSERWTHPLPAGVNGDAMERCVIGQPTIIPHSCGAVIRIELYELVSRVEAAIRNGRDKIYLRTDQATTAVSTASVKR
jgi:hypothetical protein